MDDLVRQLHKQLGTASVRLSVVTRKKKLTTSAIDASNEIQAPVDYSFFKISQVEEFEEESPNNASSLTVDKESGKWMSRALKLSNNSLTKIDGLHTFICNKFANPENLAWIDLSFNQLKSIDLAISECKQLQILYLHGNVIENVEEVRNLDSLKHLRNLTLHGNVFDQYKNRVISMLPNLLKLDFTMISKETRKTAETWQKMSSKGSKKKGKNGS